jgi:CRP/FNR family cyclic AMP-dependent transcriptional regulator
MEVVSILKSVELFDGLDPEELRAVAGICRERSFQSGQVITAQGEVDDDLYVVSEGFVEVVVSRPLGEPAPRTVVNLGRGQIFGEMALVDQGPRSATVRALTDNTVLQSIPSEAFLQLCDTNHHLGYVVMRNMAADLSFKLRHRNLANR